MRTPLPDTPSMPIGADEVTVLDHTGGYGIFVNEGKSITPHAILEVRNGAGDLIWRFDRDGKKPVQVITPQVAHDMTLMMNKVVEEGTAKRARSTASRPPARPAPPTRIATPGSSATPAITLPASGSATTTTPRPTA